MESAQARLHGVQARPPTVRHRDGEAGRGVPPGSERLPPIERIAVAVADEVHCGTSAKEVDRAHLRRGIRRVARALRRSSGQASGCSRNASEPTGQTWRGAGTSRSPPSTGAPETARAPIGRCRALCSATLVVLGASPPFRVGGSCWPPHGPVSRSRSRAPPRQGRRRTPRNKDGPRPQKFWIFLAL